MLQSKMIHSVLLDMHTKKYKEKLSRSCPLCGGKLIRRKVEVLLRGGNDVAAITVWAEICPDCGERLYTPDTVRTMDHIRKGLQHGTHENLVEIGRFYATT